MARYLTGMHHDNGWFNYSKLCQGEVFGQDTEFVGRLENLLHKQFFEGLFRFGLKRTSLLMLPLYQITANLFEQRYRKQLECQKAVYI
jgi:hypothetical protein